MNRKSKSLKNYTSAGYHVKRSKRRPYCTLSAGFKGSRKGPGPRVPHQKGAPNHVDVFSYMCDMCVPFSQFYERGKFVCRRY